MNSDPLGLGYRVVMRKLGAQSLSPIIDPPRMDAIVHTLFPNHPVKGHELGAVTADEVPLFSKEELEKPPGLTKSGKSLGAKNSFRNAESYCSFLLNIYTNSITTVFLRVGIFPNRWQV